MTLRGLTLASRTLFESAKGERDNNVVLSCLITACVITEARGVQKDTTVFLLLVASLASINSPGKRSLKAVTLTDISAKRLQILASAVAYPVPTQSMKYSGETASKRCNTAPIASSIAAYTRFPSSLSYFASTFPESSQFSSCSIASVRIFSEHSFRV